MPRRPDRSLLYVCLSWLFVAAQLTDADDAGSRAAASVDFERDVRPIFSSRCLKCHGSDEPKGDLDLTRRDSALGAGVIEPGLPAVSSLLERVTTDDEELRMPPEGERLSSAEVDILRRWITAGANWPKHWAYRPLTLPDVPLPQSDKLRQWCRTPIDNFIVSRLETAGLEPSPQADRLTLLRRASFDLRGLPPTPDEVDAFLNDPSPVAWQDCIDRLLDSPQYGERWARHWMDLVHFAETHGHDQDRPREHAWPYRDYLIQSFNADKPYAQFVREQIAGDILDPLNPDAIVATGFLAAGPWDESSLRDIREDSLDREIGRYLDRDDIVTTVMSTFASTSVHCARCHDHKFDPISQDEYYGLQAVFAATDKANRKYDPDPTVARRRAELTESLAALEQQFQSAPTELLTDEARQAIALWEQNLDKEAVRWRPLTVEKAVSQGGATLPPDDQQTVLASGPRPDKDVYVVTATVDLKQVTALRLELLTHPDLPMQGPGRQDNGNLHLNEIRCFQVLDPDAGTTRELRVVEPFADFNQQGWAITAAVDGNPNTAWGIFPAVSKPHEAVFPFQQPATSAGDTRLRIELQQIHGGGHLIGHFRLSVTDSSVELLKTAPRIPLSVGQILGVPVSERSESQQIELAHWFLRDRLQRQLADLPAQQLVYSGTSQFDPDGSFKPTPAPRTIHVLQRGLVTQPQEQATPQALSCVDTLPADFDVTVTAPEGERRLALANWLADEHNPLVWRSIVNRIWQYHFGRGLVTTPNDFGLMGASPSHPELLDWLAVTLQQRGGSLKELYRLILSSAVYQQQSASRPEALQVDADNRLLWRMTRRRLDAESYRDALLLVSGTLDPTMGGPSVRQFIQSPGAHVTPNVDYQNFNVDDPANYRRSVYRFLFRTVPDPFMEAIDCPDGSQLTPKRNVSLTALQALATLNDKLVVRLSEKFAARLTAAQPELDGQIDLAYRHLFGRLPRPEERQPVIAYAQQYGLANACRFLFNTNEFLFVD
ncbi:DUF1553 domain-containing protein [bacterium]|nr:DUF1553 domain-containing protein [bacterium]